MSELPKGPWEEITIDFYEVSGVHMFMYTQRQQKLINIFCSYGIPKVVRTDNGPPFNGSEVAQSASRYVLTIVTLPMLGRRPMVNYSVLCARLTHW